MKSILGALKGLSQEEAAKAAQSIFGRMGAADAVQMSRSLEEVEAAMQRGAAQGRNFERVAEAFDQVEKAAARIRGKLEPLWLSLAERALPAMQALANIIDNIDLKKGIWNIFADGKLTQLVSLSLQAGFETAVEWFGKAIVAVVSGAQAALTSIFSHDYGTMLKEGINGRSKIDTAQWHTDLARSSREAALRETDPAKRLELARKAMDWSNAAAGEAQEGMGMVNRGAGAAEAASKSFADGMTAAMKSAGGYSMGSSARDALMKFFRENGGVGGEAPKNEAKRPNTGLFDDLNKAAPAGGGSILEKMGFVMGGGYDNPLPYHRRTADNTGRIAEQMDTLISVVKPQPQVHT